MTLIVEDGTIVADANSYISLSELRSFALSFGVTLSTDDSELEADALKAMQYLMNQNYKGERVSKDQELDWPRKNVYLYGFEIEETTIPRDLKSAQSELVIQLHNSVDILPTVTERQLKSKTTGPLKKEWFGTEGSGPSNNDPILPTVDRYLDELRVRKFSVRRV